MTHCAECDEDIERLELRAIDTLDASLKAEGPEMGDPVLYECPHCGVVLGISQQ